MQPAAARIFFSCLAPRRPAMNARFAEIKLLRQIALETEIHLCVH